MTQTTISRPGMYRPRPIRFLGLHEVAGWRLKFYGISSLAERPRRELVETARALAPRALPRPAVYVGRRHPHDLDRYGAGFVVVHDTRDYAYALFHWWAGKNEIHQRMYSALPNHLEAMRRHPTSAIGCVWELAVVDFERRSWLRHLLTGGGDPDLEAYVADHFEDEV